MVRKGDAITESDGSDGFNESQREGLETRRTDQERTLAAMHQLEAALEAAVTGREASWSNVVATALGILDDATAEECENAARPDGLLSDIAYTQPRLRNRVRGIRSQYRQVRDAIEAISREIGQPEASMVDSADVRQRLAWILAALRHVRSRESDLIYEAYYDAFRADIE
jgi:hypothetical protein